MAEEFLLLAAKDQFEILSAVAPKLKRSPTVLEKDIWVCWVLQSLFAMPEHLPMAFKGGTALSKVYNVIQRFSEDIDITLDYRGFGKEINDGISKSAIKKLSDELKQFVADHSKNIVKPYFETKFSEQFARHKAKVEVSEDGEKLRIHYPSVFAASPERYLAPSVLIEFGGRNITEPNEQHIVSPYIAASLPDLKFPEAKITALALSRSFWEKATLIHVECNRKEPRLSAERLSRHWYDIACLSKHERSKEAIANSELLADVVKYKKLFYNSSYANYDACLKSAFRLVPGDILLKALERDFEQMILSGMFYDEQPVFSDVVESVISLEKLLNYSRER